MQLYYRQLSAQEMYEPYERMQKSNILIKRKKLYYDFWHKILLS